MPAFYIVAGIVVVATFFCGAFLFKPIGRFILSLWDGVVDNMSDEDEEEEVEEDDRYRHVDRDDKKRWDSKEE